MKKHTHPQIIATIVVLVVLILALAGYLYYGWGKYKILTKNLESGNNKIVELETNIINLVSENEMLVYQLQKEKGINESFSAQISEIAGTVGILDKLSKTDKELLQKYSKVYFLNEHFIPQEISLIDPKFTYDNQEEHIHTRVYPHLTKLMNDATANGVPLSIISAYRSFDTQVSLKSSYTVVYGSGANTFSADQGYSEHQLGTTVDFTTPILGSDFSKFNSEESYKWLRNNAHRYGFILSYPEENAYYQFEPWHWRYVGIALATQLHNRGENFYDVDQREIDKYLVNIFD
jgi:D-alanyl-D-alanine carboxypeptidase